MTKGFDHSGNLEAAHEAAGAKNNLDRVGLIEGWSQLGKHGGGGATRDTATDLVMTDPYGAHDDAQGRKHHHHRHHHHHDDPPSPQPADMPPLPKSGGPQPVRPAGDTGAPGEPPPGMPDHPVVIIKQC